MGHRGRQDLFPGGFFVFISNHLQTIVKNSTKMFDGNSALGHIVYMTTLTHRRQDSNINTGHVVLFCDSDRNASYGDHVWTLKTELPNVPNSIIEYAAEFFGVEAEEATELCNPADIVSTAGAWDDEQFCSEVASFYGPVGFKTPDGAVVFDRDEVEIEYSQD